MGVQYRPRAHKGPAPFYSVWLDQRRRHLKERMYRGMQAQRHANAHLSARCNILECYRALFQYVLRQTQGELPPAKWSLPNRARPQARTQRTLKLLIPSLRNVIKARRKNYRKKNHDLGIEKENVIDGKNAHIGHKITIQAQLQFHRVAVRALIISEPGAKLPHFDWNFTWGEIIIRMQWNIARWFSSPNNVLMFLQIDSDTAGTEKTTDGLTEPLCIVSQCWARPRPIQPVCLVLVIHLSVCLSLCGHSHNSCLERQ